MPHFAKTMRECQKNFRHSFDGPTGDNTWGWWMREGTKEKWFALKYIITVAAITVEEAQDFEDCPEELRRRSGRGRSASPTGGSGSGSRSRSRSRSRSPTYR